MSNAQTSVKLLDDVLLSDGRFDVEKARERLNAMKEVGEINITEYINLWDACNCLNDDGHYRNSLIYKRAIETS